MAEFTGWPHIINVFCKVPKIARNYRRYRSMKVPDIWKLRSLTLKCKIQLVWIFVTVYIAAIVISVYLPAEKLFCMVTIYFFPQEKTMKTCDTVQMWIFALYIASTTGPNCNFILVKWRNCAQQKPQERHRMRPSASLNVQVLSAYIPWVYMLIYVNN